MYRDIMTMIQEVSDVNIIFISQTLSKFGPISISCLVMMYIENIGPDIAEYSEKSNERYMRVIGNPFMDDKQK